MCITMGVSLTDTQTDRQTLAIKTDLAFLKLAASFSYSGASFLQCPHLYIYILVSIIKVTTKTMAIINQSIRLRSTNQKKKKHYQSHESN